MSLPISLHKQLDDICQCYTDSAAWHQTPAACNHLITLANLLQDFAKLPWEVDMPADKAAAVLGSYLGVPHLEPAAVLDLDVDQITGALTLVKPYFRWFDRMHGVRAHRRTA
jgi:hypothetical protein